MSAMQLGTDHPFYQFTKLSGRSVLKLLSFPHEQIDQYQFDAIVLKERRLEPDIQGLPILNSDLGRIFIEFQGYDDPFIRYRLVSQAIHACSLAKDKRAFRMAIIYTEKKYQAAALTIPQISAPIQEVVLTDYNLKQLLDIDPKLVVFAPFTAARQLHKAQLQEQIHCWTNVLKQAYTDAEQQNALDVLGLFVLNRFRKLSHEEVIEMMHFDLLETRAGQDILEMGEQRGLLQGKYEIVKSMLLESLPISLICKVTHLSEPEVLKLKDELDKKS